MFQLICITSSHSLECNGNLQLFVDYCKLNLKTQRDAFPLPRIDASLDVLCKAQVFSTINLASGYNQVAVHEKDQNKIYMSFYTVKKSL